MKLILPLLYAAVLLVLLEACVGKAANRKPERKLDPVPVKLEKVHREPISREIKVSGQLSTDDETYLSFKTGGIVKKVFVREGDRIQKGQLLAVLDLTEIKAQATQVRLAYEKALRDYNRAANLHRDSVATLEQFQNASTGLELSRQQLETATFNLQFSEIRALENGYVLRKFINDGQLITAGAPAIQTNGALKGRWVLRCGVGDRDWQTIRLGDAATFTMDAATGVTYKARVIRKSEGTDPATGTFMVELESLNAGLHDFASGMFARAIIQSGHAGEGWRIPLDAIVDGGGEIGYVFVTTDGRTASRKPVTIQEIGDGYAWVSAGLSDSVSVVVQGNAYLADGSPILTQQTAKP